MRRLAQTIEECELKGIELFWFGGASWEEISKLENALCVALPESFRWFLHQYGGGGIVGEDIFGIIENDFSIERGSSLYFRTLECRKKFGIPDSIIPISFPEEEFLICIETQEEPGGARVISWNLFENKAEAELATSFEEFLINELEVWLK